MKKVKFKLHPSFKRMRFATIVVLDSRFDISRTGYHDGTWKWKVAVTWATPEALDLLDAALEKVEEKPSDKSYGFKALEQLAKAIHKAGLEAKLLIT